MTPGQRAALEALSGRALTEAEAALAETRRDATLADALSVGRTEFIEKRVNVISITAILGMRQAGYVVQSLKTFRDTPLPAGHPLKDDEEHAKLMLGYLWEANTGLDLGNAQTQQMLGIFSQFAEGTPGYVSPANAAKLKAAAMVPAPISTNTVSAILNSGG